MATEDAAQVTVHYVKDPLYLVPKFTSERWSGGMCDAEHNRFLHSMNIRQEDLLTFHQKVEVETRSLIFQYQLKYAEKEYQLLKKEFQKIEERLSKREASDAEPAEHDFTKPVVPVGKKSRKTGKNRTTSKSGSETDGKEDSADEPVVSDDGKTDKKLDKPKRVRAQKKSGSETDEKEASTEEPGVEKSTKRRGRPPKTNPTKSMSGSETEKELTSSLEGADEPRRSERKGRKK